MEKTVLCYIENNNDYLMLHRTKKKNDLNEGKWIGVGGHIEEGENKEEAVRREVLEETGLDIEKFNYRATIYFQDDDFKETMYLFTAKSPTREVIKCNEGDLKWIKKADVLKLNLWDGDHIFLEKLISESDYFNLYLYYKNGKLVKSE